MSYTWVEPVNNTSVFNKLATSRTVKNLQDSFSTLECSEGLIKYNLMWAIANAQLLIVNPQMEALCAILETSLPAYEFLNDTLKFSYAISKPTKPKLVKKFGTSGSSSCLDTNSLSAAVANALNGSVSSLNKLIYSGVKIQNQIMSMIGNFLSNIALSWLSGTDLFLFPIIEALETCISSTGIGKNLVQMAKLKTCLKSHCKQIEESNFKSSARFYKNNSLIVPVDSKYNLDLAKFWIFYDKGEGLNTQENRQLLAKLKRRYNKYKKEKGKLFISNFMTLFTIIADAFNSAINSIGNLPSLLIDTSNVFLDSISALGSGIMDYVSSLESSSNILDSLNIKTILGSVISSLESTYLNATDNATPIYNKAYSSSTGYKNNNLTSSTSISTYF